MKTEKVGKINIILNNSFMVENWALIIHEALQDFWQGFVGFIPALIGAILVFVIGWFISIGVGKLVAKILGKLRFNQFFEKGGWKEALEKAEFKVDAAGFVGAIVKWVLVIVFLYAAVGILNWEAFGRILEGIIAYLPNVIVAALIFVVAVIVADIVAKVVRVALEGAKFAYAHIGEAITKWAIWIFAILMILRQLLIVPELIDIVFGALVYGVMAFLVISIGIAFGLGGKEIAAEILRDLHRKLKR